MELLIALAIMAVLIIPVMQLFSSSLYGGSFTQDLISATSLARWQMERVKNLNMTKAQLIDLGDFVYPEENREPLELNDMKWRIKTEFVKGTDPLEVRVGVYKEGQPYEPIVTLVTLIEDMFWEEIQAIR